ncbi:DUF1826 domain-containing protein [Aurantivibrio plasticivorans]
MQTAQNELRESVIISSDLDELTRIYDPSCNLAVWLREENATVSEYTAFLVASGSQFQQFQKSIAISAVENELGKQLPEHPARDWFIADLMQTIEMFACLFDLRSVGFRLTKLDCAMCPKFHVDRVPCRLLLNYCGGSTEWLPNHVVDRTKLGPASFGIPDEQPGLLSGKEMIQMIPTRAIALLKGESWEGNEGFGLVHRSPGATPDNPRLLLSLDFA